MSLIRGVLLVGKFRTQHELNKMSPEDQRNTLITELIGRSNQSNFQSFDDATLAGAGAVLVFLREAKIRDDRTLKTMSADDQRNTLIAEIGAQTQLGSQLQGLSNMDLVLRGLSDKNSRISPPQPTFIRGVLLVGKFRTQHELNKMSHEDQRNTLIVELANRSNQSNFQSFDDATLAGMGAVLVFLREAKIRDDRTLKTMSADDQRNTLIVEIGIQTQQGSRLQGLRNMDLVRLGLGVSPAVVFGEGLLANNGDLDQSKYKAWASAIKKDYYAHNFFHDKIPVWSGVNPPFDDRDEGGFSERYSTLRNANGMFAKFLADTVLWEADPLGVSSKFFKTLPTPKGATPLLYQDDSYLANFLLNGPDPTTLELVTKETKLPFSNLQSHPPGLEKYGRLPAGFDAALQDGRVFHVDFRKYDGFMSSGRFTSWPHAIFMSSPHTDSFGNTTYQLLPIAISLIPPGQASKQPVTVFPNSNTHETPPCTWEIAKRVFLSAVANYHELGTHLGRCHLVMERYALATYRNLPPWHPVGRLLRPHFKFMVATNNDAFKNLINEGGPVDKNFMASMNSLLKVSLDAFSSWDLKTHGGIEADLKRRGLLAADCKLPFWPYKEFGLKIYGVIQTFVRSYLRLWYGTGEATYEADVALQNWRRALREDYRAGTLMEPNASFEDLVTACTNMIWTCGPQHSAVNYSQYDFLADAKTLPFAIQREPGATMFEPSRKNIGDQAEVISRLALFRYDQLGVYSTAPFLTEYGDLGNPQGPWKFVVDRFQHELRELGAQQPVPSDHLWNYSFLLPVDITNSISI